MIKTTTIAHIRRPKVVLDILGTNLRYEARGWIVIAIPRVLNMKTRKDAYIPLPIFFCKFILTMIHEISYSITAYSSSRKESSLSIFVYI